MDSDPKGPENRPHQYTYNLNPYPEQDTVIASEMCRTRAARPEPEAAPPGMVERAIKEVGGLAARTDNGTMMRLNTDDLIRLAPRLRPYLRTSAPGWPDIVDAADWLRHDLGVSKSLWGEACVAMGREAAAIALAIVSAKPAEHFTSSAGGYFHGMVTKAKAGQLNLARTVWGLRTGGKPGAARKAPPGGPRPAFLS